MTIDESKLKELAKQIFSETADRYGRGYVEYGRELPFTWGEISAKCKAGNYDGIRVGDYKTIKLSNNETVICEVAGIDTYYKCGDTAIPHHIDFISRDCLAGTKKFNETNTNNGTEAEPNPWRASKLFQTMNNTTDGVVTLLPGDLASVIIEKRALLESRYSASGALDKSSGWAWNNMGKLWLPTEVEVFGHATWSQNGYGTGGGGCNLQYPIFAGGAKHIIKGAGNGGGRCDWWEASAHVGNTTYVCAVISYGVADHYIAGYASIYAPLCFRVA